MEEFNLKQYGIEVKNIVRNPSPSKLYEDAIRRDAATTISDRGALIAYSGDKDRPLARGQAHRTARRVGWRCLVGRRQHPARSEAF